jgi:hypothetical protein
MLQCDIGDYEVTGKNLAEAFNLVLICRNDNNLAMASRMGKYDPTEIDCALLDSFDAMEFIKRIRLEAEENGDIVFIENEDGEERRFPSYGTVKMFKRSDDNDRFITFEMGQDHAEDPSNAFFYLEHIDYILDADTADAAVDLKYHSFDETCSVSVLASENESFRPPGEYDIITQLKRSAAILFRRISGYLPGTRPRSSFFRGTISSHYRYHNMLAPSVVDAIDDDRDAKSRLLEVFAKKGEAAYRHTLEPALKMMESQSKRASPYTWEEKVDDLCSFVKDSANDFRRLVDWDALVSRILIYNGPTGLIKAALLNDGESGNDRAGYKEKDKDHIDTVCRHIIAGLEMRYIDSIFDAESVSRKKDEIYEVFGSGIGIMKEYFPGVDYITELECRTLAQSYIDAIVKTLTKIEENDSENKHRFNKFAENSIQDSLRILEGYSARPDKNSKNAQQTFLRSVTAFLAFYEGVYECRQPRLIYEFEKSASILEPARIEYYRERIDESFIAGVRKEAGRLKEIFSSEDAVKKALIELWNSADKNLYRTEERNKYYQAILARPPMSHSKLSRIYEVDGDHVYFKKDERNYDIDSIDSESLRIMFLRSVLDFLAGNSKDGADSENMYRGNHTAYKERIMRVVYPQVVSFTKHSQDPDANESLIMMNMGNAFADWNDGGVCVLTEFKHKINRAYYVLPNMGRIDMEWWVDPLLIPCYKFDKAMRDVLSDKDVIQ